MKGIAAVPELSASQHHDDAEIVANLLLEVASHPHDIQPLVALGSVFARAGRLTEARVVFQRVLAIDERNLDALWALSDLEQVLGNTEAALSAQCRAIALRPVFQVESLVYQGEVRTPLISVLMLCIPGTFQANAPLEYIANGSKVVLHKWYLTGAKHCELPPYDIIFTAIGHDPSVAEILAEAQAFVDGQSHPIINEPRLIQNLARENVVKCFADSQLINVAPVERLGYAELQTLPIQRRVLVRPIASQAGDRLALLRNERERDRYLESAAEIPEFYVMPFVDYRSEDGYYRKYRIAFIDGEAYPVHLAISPRWMVHFYNSAMVEHAWMRREEETFLSDISSVFNGALGLALREIATNLPFTYFAADCGIAPDGRVLLFEADTAMLIHLQDSAELFPYKRQYIERIVDAVDLMFARRVQHHGAVPEPLPMVAFDSDLELDEPMSSPAYVPNLHDATMSVC